MPKVDLSDLAELAANLAPLLTGSIKLPGERIVELSLELALEISRGQSDETKKQIWDWIIEDQKRWRRWLKIDPEPPGA